MEDGMMSVRSFWYAASVAVACWLLGLPLPVRAQGVVIDPSGNVGIGTSSPNYLFEVNGGSGGGQLFSLVTTGNNVRFGLDSAMANWTIANQSTSKLRIREDGAGVVAFELDPAGNLVLSGTITATGFLPSSSRTIKTDIAPVDESAILDAISRLPIYTWRYKADAGKRVEMGPMAEDFRDAFGIGDGAHLSLIAASGASFAAIKGLSGKVDDNRAQLEAMIQLRDAEINELREMNARILARVQALETSAPSGRMILNRSGSEKVAN